MTRILTPLLLILALLTAGCAASSANRPAELNVFAAASLQEAFTGLAAEFEAAHPGVEVRLNFAGSQSLRLQIEEGAPVDLFASANPEQMQALQQAGLMRPPVIFTRNRMVVILPATNPAGITALEELARPGLKLVLANPAVPAGQYARAVLANLNPTLGVDFSGRVLANLVSEEENVKGVLAKVQLGEADAGIVYISDVTPAVKGQLRLIEFPGAANVQAAYPLAVAAHSPAPHLARQFAEFVLSSRGQSVLAMHGFNPARLEAVGQQP
ncbi:MAG: molybdate ABC transporter substrate-binding protein [Anaerolineae bacterium]